MFRKWLLFWKLWKIGAAILHSFGIWPWKCWAPHIWTAAPWRYLQRSMKQTEVSEVTHHFFKKWLWFSLDVVSYLSKSLLAGLVYHLWVWTLGSHWVTALPYSCKSKQTWLEGLVKAWWCHGPSFLLILVSWPENSMGPSRQHTAVGQGWGISKRSHGSLGYKDAICTLYSRVIGQSALKTLGRRGEIQVSLPNRVLCASSV